ncbi:MAG TPA: hypothetical protein VH597_04530 [Verrucomicrobiae bacterium]|jgi:hypothetical protein|nr:hypothetical protein [Verrucomicrobiae bacterium]
MSVSSCLKVGLAFVISTGGMMMPRAATINVTTNDNYTKIESAKAGDEVLISPGKYAFRVYLTQQASPTNPIVIRALDPANPPVWDFTNTLVENAPGSYGAGDRGRGGWQFSGASGYKISGIVFRNCRTASFNSAGIRYYNTTTNLCIKDCLFNLDDNGLTGGTQNSEATVEFCEFNANGNTNASSSAPTHNIYVYGGDLTMRYCYVHDPVQGQNFHIRCHNAVLEYNWFARANAYEGDLMSDDDFSGSGPFVQTMTLRGNVFVQKNSPLNNSQVIAMFNDASLTNLTLNVRAIFNTFVGNGGSAAFVHVSNADHTQMNAELSDNIISDTTRPYLIEYPATGTVTGQNNWLKTNATIGALTGSVQSASPGFRNAATQDYTLTNASACIGAASTSVFGLPGKEYWLNEVTNRHWRIRAAARDIGAFESGSTNAPIGPYDIEPRPVMSIAPGTGSVTASWPLFAQDFQLQQSPLTTLSTWSNALYPQVTNATAVLAIVPINADSLFRLKK